VGLDAAEFLMEIESEFGISIAAEDSVRFRTLGNLHDYLLEKCAGWKRTDCPARSAFYRLRKALAVVLDVDPRPLRPSTPLLPLLGTWGRPRKWSQLRRELGLDLPPLEDRAGAGVFWGMVTAAVVSFRAATMLARDVWLALGIAIFSLLPGVLLGYILGVCWPRTAGRSFRTLGGLAREMVARNDREFPFPDGPSTDNDPLWTRLCDVAVKQLGAGREELRRDTRFVEDLGF
jgi:hypothetical protein